MLSHRQRLAGSAIFSLTLVFLATDRAALADCSAVGDVVTCDAAGGDNSPYDAGAGNNTINIVSGSFADSINGNAGADTFTGTGGTVGSLNGQADADSFSLQTGFSVVGNVSGGDAADFLGLSGATVGGDLLGDAGDDSFSLTSGVVGDDVLGGAGEDDIVLDGATVVGDLAGEADDDLILIGSGSVGGSVLGGDDDDIILIGGGIIGGNVEGGAGEDLIGIGGTASIGGDILTGDGVVNGVIIGNPFDGTGDASIGGDIIGGSGVDIVALVNVGTFTGTVDTGANTDIIYILGGTSIIDPSLTGDFNDQLGSMAGLVGGDGNDYLVLDNVGSGAPATLPPIVSGIENIAVVNDSAVQLVDPLTNTRDLSDVNQFLIFDSAVGAFGDNGQASLFIGGNVANVGGTIFMANGDAGDVFEIGGDYAGAVGTTEAPAVVLDAALDVSQVSDRLVIDGSVGDVVLSIPELSASGTVTSGTTELAIHDVGNGIGSWTGKGPNDGIALVTVGGVTNPGDFTLVNADTGVAGPIQVGVFDYNLSLEGNTWFLQSDLLDQGFAYAAIPAGMLAVQNLVMGSLYERVGDIRQVIGGAQLNDPADSMTGLGGYSGVWARGLGAWSTHDGDMQVGGASVPTSFDQDTGLGQVGADFDVTSSFGMNPADGSLVLGISGVGGKTWLHADDDAGNKASDWDSTIYGGAVTATYYMPNGIYADFAGQVLWYDGTVSTVSEGDKADVNGFGWGVGAEAGYQIPVSRFVQIVPNGRLNYNAVNFDDFTDSDNVSVSMNDGSSLEGRIGVVIDAAMRPGRGAWFTAYVEGNIVHEFLDKASVDAAGTDLGYDLSGTAGELGLGMSVRVVQSVSLYGQVDYQIPFDSDEGTKTLQATGGLRVAF